MADHSITQSGIGPAGAGLGGRDLAGSIAEGTKSTSTDSKPCGTPFSQVSTTAGTPLFGTSSLDFSDLDRDGEEMPWKDEPCSSDELRVLLSHMPRDDDLVWWLLSGNPVAQSYFIGAKEEFVKKGHCPDSSDSETHTPSEDTTTRFSSGIAKPIHMFSSSRAEAACKGEAPFVESDDLVWPLLSGDPVAQSYFIGAKEELVKKDRCPDVLDWGVFELLSETHTPSEDTISRFSPGIVPKAIHVFSSSQAEAACTGARP